MFKYLISLFFVFNFSLAHADENQPLNPFCQNHIKTVKLVLNKSIMNTEIACTEQAKEYGLMNRTSLPTNNGMLFIFDRTQTLSFWMKNTLIDLSIAYIDQDWNIVDIREMKSQDLTPIISKKPAIFALEANSYWFSKNNIKIGDKIQMIN